MAAIPIPDDVTTSADTSGGVPVIHVTVAGAASDTVIFYLHGGAYAIGTAASSVGLASDLARRAGTKLVTVDYGSRRSTPTQQPSRTQWHTVDCSHRVRSSSIAVAGESAGAGLAAATLVALKQAGLPVPAAAALMSPWADLTLSGTSLSSKADLDPALTPRWPGQASS